MRELQQGLLEQLRTAKPVGRLVIDVVLIQVRAGHGLVREGERWGGYDVASGCPRLTEVDIGPEAESVPMGEHDQRPRPGGTHRIPDRRRERPARREQLSMADRWPGGVDQCECGRRDAIRRTPRYRRRRNQWAGRRRWARGRHRARR